MHNAGHVGDYVLVGQHDSLGVTSSTTSVADGAQSVWGGQLGGETGDGGWKEEGGR